MYKIIKFTLILCSVYLFLAFLGVVPSFEGSNLLAASFTLVSFAELGVASGLYDNLAGVADQSARVVGDQIFIGDYNKIIGVHAYPGAACTGVRLTSPSLRRVNPLQIAPFGVGIAPALIPEVFMCPENPKELVTNEGLECERVDGAATNHAVAVLLADQNIQPINGDIRTIAFTVTITPVDLTFVNANINFVDDLPVGKYKVVGARLVMAGACFFRFVPVGSANRPGGSCAVLATNQDVKEQRNGMLGEWFEFDTNTPPTIDVLSTTTPGAGTYAGVMDVIQA